MTRIGPAADSDAEDRPGWRGAIESDPLGLVTHREWETAVDPDLPTQPGTGGLGRLGLGVIAVLVVAFASGYGETVLVVLALILCIVGHEFGHYIAAKTGRVKVTEFFVGFGPRLWSVRHGETEYGVKGIPLGGYCRIIGMNNLEAVAPADETRTYRHAPLWRRLLIDVAGPGMNFLIAIVVLFAMFFWTGDNGNYLSKIPADNRLSAILAFSNEASPAQIAGLRAGDRIEAIDGKKFTSWEVMGSFIQSHPGQALDLSVDRGGRLLQLFATPVAADTVHVADNQGLPTGKAGFIGIAVDPVIHSGFTASIGHAGSALGWVTTRTLSAFGHLFTAHGVSSYFHMLSSQKAADNPTNSVRFSSPVKVVQIINEASGSGFATVLWLLAIINISLGIFNLLPIFPLDGGRVVVALYEGVRSHRRPSRVDMAKLLPILYAGLALIAFIGVTAIFLDLRDLVA